MSARLIDLADLGAAAAVALSIVFLFDVRNLAVGGAIGLGCGLLVPATLGALRGS